MTIKMSSSSPEPTYDPVALVLLEGAVEAFMADAQLTGMALLAGSGVVHLITRRRRGPR